MQRHTAVALVLGASLLMPGVHPSASSEQATPRSANVRHHAAPQVEQFYSGYIIASS